jgi:hypothetical protein
MIVYIDIDNTICENGTSNDYSVAQPIKENIAIANSLYKSGHTIVYWTARGSGTGKDWSEVTASQFKQWGVLYHEIKFGKPIYDIFIDDKALTSLKDSISLLD